MGVLHLPNLCAREKFQQQLAIFHRQANRTSLSGEKHSLSDSDVQKAVSEVDSLCLQYLESLFQAMGFTDDLVRAKARIIYAGYIGNIMLGGNIPIKQETLLVEELLKVVD